MTIRIQGEIATRQVWIDDKELLPAKSQKVCNHSPDGFCWGYCGSGPSQLALAILLEFTDKETALANYQRFKRDKVAGWADDFDETFEISDWLI